MNVVTSGCWSEDCDRHRMKDIPRAEKVPLLHSFRLTADVRVTRKSYKFLEIVGTPIGARFTLVYI
jgi:hypothetical protein